MKKFKDAISLQSLEELGKDDGVGLPTEVAAVEQVKNVPLEELHKFKNHPFKVLDDEKMQETVESIQKYGVLMPALVRKHPEGGYEMVSGHRRWHASKLAGFTEMPVIIRKLTDDEATVVMVDSNIQRENLLPSEKARAYKMKYDALRHQGVRQGGRTLDEIGKRAGESGKTVQRYIWLSRLSDELLELVDNRRLGFRQGVDISFLDDEFQEQVCSLIRNYKLRVTTVQSEQLKSCYKNGGLDKELVEQILTGRKKETARKVTIKAGQLSRYFPEEYDTEQIESIIYQLLDEWKQRREAE